MLLPNSNVYDAFDEEARDIYFKQCQEEILAADTDALTGLPNRYRLTDYSQKLMDEAFCEQVPYAIAILDIDYFKEYNDNYGLL